MRNKKLINRRNGSSVVINIALEKEGGKKKKKSKLVQHGVIVFGHQSKY